MRIISLDENNVVYEVKYISGEYELRSNELESEHGDIGDVYEEGVFTKTNSELSPFEKTQPTIEQAILYETQYQTVLLEIVALGGNL